MKKALKIFGIVVGILLLVLIVTPILFKGSLEKILNRTINENLNATVSWEKLDLSLLRSFPDASLSLQEFSVENKFPFEGDTLVSGKNLSLRMGIMQLFKTKALKIDAVSLDGAFINIRTDSLGNANYDITLKESPSAEKEESETDFSFELQNYEITNSRVSYLDESSGIFLTLNDIEHKGKGDLSQTISKLDTKTRALISFKMGDTQYLTRHKIALDAVLEIDLENQKYSFLENEARINELPLTFDGYVKLHEDHNEIDLTFKTPSSDFKNFLAVIPETYLKQIQDVKTTGDFTVDGKLQGIVDSLHIPTMDIAVRSDNASFKYPDLPREVTNIHIDANLKNETGLLKDTYLNLPKLTFTIDANPFAMHGTVRNMTDNPMIDMAMKGTLNLAHIDQVLPLENKMDLSGIFTADMTAKFDMESVDKQQYEKIDARGTAALTDFIYKGGFKNDFQISKAGLNLQPGKITLTEFAARTGGTDFKASGTIQNLVSFVMGKEELIGNFSLNSTVFDISDFMVSDSPDPKAEKTEVAASESEAVKIPSFLDATLNFHLAKVIYDNLELMNARGTAAIKDETISIRNFTSDIFGGTIAFSGKVSTKEEVPDFLVQLDLNHIDIDESFKKLEFFQFLVPIAKAFQGNLDTRFNMSGKLTQDLSPQLTTLSGDAFAKIVTAEVNPEQTPLLASLNQQVGFLNLGKLKLDDITTNFAFDNGEIQVKPFHFDVEGIGIDVGGKHGLDQTIDYSVNLDVPASYFGSQVTKLLQELDPKEAKDMRVAIPVGIGGSFTQPKINLNTEAAVNELTQKLVAKQKEKLKEKGAGILEGFLSGGSGKDTTQTKQETKTEGSEPKSTEQETKEKLKNLFDGFIRGKDKKTEPEKKD